MLEVLSEVDGCVSHLCDSSHTEDSHAEVALEQGLSEETLGQFQLSPNLKKANLWSPRCEVW